MSFYDKAEVERLLRDPNVQLITPASVFAQVSGLSSAAFNAQIEGRIHIVDDPDLSDIPNLLDFLSPNLNIVDAILLETAKDTVLPVITLDRALIRQVRSHPERKEQWGMISILVPPFPYP
jgi:hypothetical protein